MAGPGDRRGTSAGSSAAVMPTTGMAIWSGQHPLWRWP